MYDTRQGCESDENERITFLQPNCRGPAFMGAVRAATVRRMAEMYLFPTVH